MNALTPSPQEAPTRLSYSAVLGLSRESDAEWAKLRGMQYAAPSEVTFLRVYAHTILAVFIAQVYLAFVPTLLLGIWIVALTLLQIAGARFDRTLADVDRRKITRSEFYRQSMTSGVRRSVPVQTEFTNSDRIRQDRLQAHAVEAAEQCGGTYVPEVAALARLERLLQDWPVDRAILFCDEGLAGQAVGLPDASNGQPWAILIGPEGGFSEAERTRLAAMPNAHAISLGPRILRADTAAVAALTLWQQHLGDWR